MLLNFALGDDCPCPEEIQEDLLVFHDDLRIHCGKTLLTHTHTRGVWGF